jgi:hypothetical protein
MAYVLTKPSDLHPLYAHCDQFDFVNSAYTEMLKTIAIIEHTVHILTHYVWGERSRHIVLGMIKRFYLS